KTNKTKVLEGERLFAEAMAMKRTLLGPEHVELATGLYNFGEHLKRHARRLEAEQPLRESFLMRQRLLGLDHADTIRVAGGLGDLLLDLKRYGEAEPLHRIEYQSRLKKLDPSKREDAKYLAGSLRSLGADLLYLGRYSEAEPLLRQCLEIRQRIFTANERRPLNSMSLL